ncbi:class I SAM-dependent methyltransferase [Verrucomicrobia bacterium]|nr:class I SAM-dependent methyltransferase [Verrucomicrobiota bacterium]
MNPPNPSKPTGFRYVDQFLESFASGNADSIEAMGRHLHMGFFDDPTMKVRSASESAKGAEAMSAKVIEVAGVLEGEFVLDVGCGFGGTLSCLGRLPLNLNLTGLNIDPRQIERARTQLDAVGKKEFECVQGDATCMPFDDESFDVIIAIELTCHLDDPSQFFAEAQRVLRPGGRLVIADYAVAGLMKPFAVVVDVFLGPLFTRVYGRLNCTRTMEDYSMLADSKGFEPCESQDITRNTLPNYEFLRRLLRSFDMSFLEKRFNDIISLTMECAARMGALRYVLLTFARK